jgi:hypothetical protein
MKKFIKGTLELDENVTDLESYEKKKEVYLKAIRNFCDQFDIEYTMGTSDDNYYLIEYAIRGNTKSLCKGILTEFKALLKRYFPYVKLVWQQEGNILW